MSIEALNWAIKAKTGDATSKAVLIVLANVTNPETGQCTPSQSYVADVCELSRPAVCRAINRLESLGFLVKIPRNFGGRTASCGYSLRCNAELQRCNAELQQVSPSVTGVCNAPLHTGVTLRYTSKEKPNKETKEDTSPNGDPCAFEKNQQPENPKPKPDKPKSAVRKKLVPPDWKPSASTVAWYKAKGYASADGKRYLEAFVNKAIANGYPYADIDRAFMNSVNEDWGKIRKGSGQATHALTNQNQPIVRDCHVVDLAALERKMSMVDEAPPRFVPSKGQVHQGARPC